MSLKPEQKPVHGRAQLVKTSTTGETLSQYLKRINKKTPAERVKLPVSKGPMYRH